MVPRFHHPVSDLPLLLLPFHLLEPWRSAVVSLSDAAAWSVSVRSATVHCACGSVTVRVTFRFPSLRRPPACFSAAAVCSPPSRRRPYAAATGRLVLAGRFDAVSSCLFRAGLAACPLGHSPSLSRLPVRLLSDPRRSLPLVLPIRSCVTVDVDSSIASSSESPAPALRLRSFASRMRSVVDRSSSTPGSSIGWCGAGRR